MERCRGSQGSPGGRIEWAAGTRISCRLPKADKKNQGAGHTVIGKYSRELDRFLKFCKHCGVFAARMITRDLLISYSTSWPELYPCTMTRAQVQARLKYFLRFCVESGWLRRVPKMTPIRVDEPPRCP